MGRIEACLKQLKDNRITALIPFLTAGDPNPELTVALLHELVTAGANIIEVGIPFSDPMADGPVIQLADERALKQGVTLKGILAMVKTFRSIDQDTPIVLMGYLNPIEVYGYQAFAEDANDAGVDGVLIVDLPPEAAGDLNVHLDQNGISPIHLIAPTTKEKRIRLIASAARGYLYYVSLKGVTGVASVDPEAVKQKLEVIRKITDLPLCVGFGIKDAASAKAIGDLAEGVVVGSALVNIIAANQTNKSTLLKETHAFINSLRTALDQ
jgi:tryptophan synthase alpha chain